MNKNSIQKVSGVLKEEEGKKQSAMQSSNEAEIQKQGKLTTLVTLENSPDQKNLLGFQPSKPLEEDEQTTNAWLVMAFAAKLGALVEWKKLELKDGREVLALCFPTNAWKTNSNGSLIAKKAGEK